MPPAIDLSGRRFGLLVVSGAAPCRPGGKRHWRCDCDCGTKGREVEGGMLRSGRTRSCGCLRGLPDMDAPGLPDLSGRIFGRLTVLRAVEWEGRGQLWLCRCSCGGERRATTDKLSCGDAISCGCAAIDAARSEAGRASRRKPKPSRRLDLAGQRSGMLEAIRPTGKLMGESVEWECRCDCGGSRTVGAGAFRAGKVRSCGCRQ